MQPSVRALRPPRRTRTAPAVAARAVRAWLLTLSVLVVHFFGLAHFVVFTHSRCEHGELVDGPSRHEANAGDTDHRVSHIGSPVGGEASADEAAQGHPDGGHEHCAGAGIAPATVAIAPACPPLTLLEAFVPPSDARGARAVQPLPILALAPKSSPPV